MRVIVLFRFKILILLVSSTMLYSQSFGQLRRGNVIAESKALARKSEANVVLINTSTMGSIMTKCIEQGIGEVQLIFTRLKSGDVNEYVSNHPAARGYEKDLVGKMTVLLKVEGDNITDDTFTSNDSPQNNSLNELINSSGLVRLRNPYGDLPSAAKTVYLDVGQICPPPTSCN